MASRLGDAFVAISAQGKDFGTQVSKLTKTATETASKLYGSVNITAKLDDAAVKLGFADLIARRDELNNSFISIPADIKDKGFAAKRLDLLAKIDAMNRKKIEPDIELGGAAKFSAQLLRLQVQADKLKDTLKNENIGGSRSVVSRAASAIGGLVGIGGGGGASGASGAAGGASSAAGSGVPLIGALPPQAQVAAVAAALASLPFIAQAVAGSIVFALGGALAGIAILGASKSAAVVKQFDNLKTQASGDLAAIGVAFVPVVRSILSSASTLIGNLTPVFANAATIISGPFKAFGNALIAAFGKPAVIQSIDAVASAFGSILKSLTPQLAGDVGSIANGITNIANAVSKNPKAFADFVSGLFKIAGGALTIIADLTLVADWIEAHWATIGPPLEAPFKNIGIVVEAMMTFVKGIITAGLDVLKGKWGAAWDELKATLGKIFDDIKKSVGNLVTAWDALVPVKVRTQIATVFDGIRHDVAAHMSEILSNVIDVWDKIWTETIGRAIQFGHDVEDAFNNLKQWLWNDFLVPVTGFFTTTLPNALIRTVNSVKNDFVNPFKTALGNVEQWVYNDFILKIGTFFDTTLPGYFRTAVTNIGVAWGAIEGIFKTPVNWVLQHVIDPLDSGINAVAGFVGLHPNLPTTLSLAAGGKITQGSGPTADNVLARVSRGETVVSAAHSAMLAPLFGAVGVPGYAAGGAPLPGGHGGGAPGNSSGSQLGALFAGAGDVAKILIALASGNSTAAVNAFTALLGGPTAGGATGGLGNMLLALPVTLIKDAVSFLLSPVKNFASAKQSAAAAATAAGGSAGSATPGLITVAKYVMSHGGTRASGAGVGGVVAGESGGDPEAQQAGGGGGQGIIQWTPGSSAFPIRPIITGNADRDMGVQLVDMMAYIGSRGGIGDLNKAGAAGGPLAAAELFSAMEAPLVPGSDIRASVVEQLYAQGYAAGGVVTPASWLNQFKSTQASEYGVWAGLYNAFRGHTRGAAGTQLKALAHAQAAEEAGYDRILGGGDTPGNMALLAGRLRAVAAGARGSALTKAHPGWMKNLGIWVARLLGMATGSAPPFTGTNQFGGPVNPPWNPGSLGPSMNVAGGVQTFDRGGQWPSGTWGWNGSGRTETVVPGGGAQNVTIVVENHGVIGSATETDQWLMASVNRLARTGKLTQAVKRAAGSN